MGSPRVLHPSSPATLYAESRAIYTWDQSSFQWVCLGSHTRRLSYAGLMNEKRRMYMHQRIRLEGELKTNRDEVEKVIERRNDERRMRAKRNIGLDSKPVGIRRSDRLATCRGRRGIRKTNVKMAIRNLLN